MGKSTINVPFLIAMLVYQRIFLCETAHMYIGTYTNDQALIPPPEAIAYMVACPQASF
jgi:hypothetical protein